MASGESLTYVKLRSLVCFRYLSTRLAAVMCSSVGRWQNFAIVLTAYAMSGLVPPAASVCRVWCGGNQCVGCGVVVISV